MLALCAVITMGLQEKALGKGKLCEDVFMVTSQEGYGKDKALPGRKMVPLAEHMNPQGYTEGKAICGKALDFPAPTHLTLVGGCKSEGTDGKNQLFSSLSMSVQKRAT